MNFYRDITFAAPTASLTNFPVLVRLQNDRMKKRISSEYGYDVAFRQNETNLAFDLDFYDASTGTGAWWVQVPSLPSNTTSTIRMVYGDSSVTTNQSSPATVWADYAYVYHFNDLNDLSSVVGSYTMTEGHPEYCTRSLVSNALTGRGMRFWDTRGYGDNYYSLSLGNGFETTTGTISILASTDVIGYGDREVRINTGWTAYRYEVNLTQFLTYAGNTSSTMTRSAANGFYCYGGSCNASEVGWSVNGVIQNTSSATAGHIRWDYPMVKITGYTTTPTEIIFDEMRISSNTYKPSAWLQYEQLQTMNHTSCTTYGSEYHSDGTMVLDFYPWQEPLNPQRKTF